MPSNAEYKAARDTVALWEKRPGLASLHATLLAQSADLRLDGLWWMILPAFIGSFLGGVLGFILMGIGTVRGIQLFWRASKKRSLAWSVLDPLLQDKDLLDKDEDFPE